MADYDEIDEAEEEALLKSDDENDMLRAKKSLLTGTASLLPPVDDEDSLMEQLDEVDAKKNLRKNESDDGNEDDNDEDDDSGDESMDASNSEYVNLLKELEENKYVYDKYLRLCELAHSSADLDNIRQAYNLFASVFPLAPDLWLKYLQIEMSLANSEQEIINMVSLFRRALNDYYSIEIAFEFAKFAKQTTDFNNIWHEILGIYGCHCLKGQEFFKLYRKELTNLTTLSSNEIQDLYIKSFLRELKLPLNNMEESYIEFKVFFEKNKTQITIDLDWQLIDNDYYKAKSYLEQILIFERQLETIDPKFYRERAEIYEKYIKEADDYLDENILQTIYERMVADCCLNPNCWQTYIDFIEERDLNYGRPEQLLDLPLFKQSALDVCVRALRNCTWSEQLYITRMQLLEKLEKPREVIQEVLESSLSAGFQTAEPAVAIWFEYLTYLRRHTDWENEIECEILRKNFNLAWTILGQQWGVLADSNCEILQFWGRLEYGPLMDPKRGKELWTTVMESSDNASKSGLWIEFAQLEMRRDLDATRKLYRKALHATSLDNPNVIITAWERFERCNGSIESLKSCQKECTKFLTQFNAQYSTKNINNIGKGSKRKSTISNDVSTETKKYKTEKQNAFKDKSPIKESTKKQTKQQLQQQSTRDDGKHVAFKEHENSEIDLTKDHLRIFLSNLDYNLTEDDIRTNLSELEIVNINLIRSANGRSRGFGYLELASEADVEKALAMDRRTLNNRPLYISSVLRDKEKRQKFKYSDGLEPKKLFVKGLPQDTTKEEVEEFFSKYGKLQDVRLVYHKSGKFKNIAYVEFVDEADASKAVLSADQTEFRDHTLSVAISAPPPKPTTSSSGNPNVLKTLGLTTKRSKASNEQKPRMSLIPNIVRRQLTGGATKLMAPPIQPPPTANGTIPTPKTNADFRKLLEK